MEAEDIVNGSFKMICVLVPSEVIMFLRVISAPDEDYC